MTFYPLAMETFGNEEEQAINDVVASGRFSMGPAVARFESQFAEFFGSRHAIMVNSGSSANLLAVASMFYRSAVKLAPGDQVIVPAVGWSTSYTPFHQYGLKLKFVDIDRQTLNYDMDALASALDHSTKAVLAINALGNPNDLPRLAEMCSAADAILLEDNCESMGARIAGRAAGTYGLLGTFSFFFSHHISTMEGGMVLTDDDELRDIMLSLRAHGWTRDLSDKNTLVEKKLDPFQEMFRFILPGYNVRPLELSGALGEVQLRRFPSFLSQRRQNAAHFVGLFSELEPALSVQREIGESSWFGFAIVLNQEAGTSRKQLVNAFGQAGVECRPVIAGNFLKQSVVDYFDYSVHQTLENADIVHNHGLFIGNHHVDMRAKIDKVYAIVREVMGS